jgi:hypothetical protein
MLVMRGWAVRMTVAMLVAAIAEVGAAADDLKAGWTPAALVEASTACTEELVQGAWSNTKREQGVDPAKPLTPEIRKQLEPQIAAMKKLCECAVRKAAARYSKAEGEASPKDLDRFVAGVVESGACKLEP